MFSWVRSLLNGSRQSSAHELPIESVELARKLGMTIEELAKFAKVKPEAVAIWLKSGRVPQAVLDLLKASLIEQDSSASDGLHSSVKNSGEGTMPDIKFDTTIGLSNPLISDKILQEMLTQYGPATPNNGVPYAALVFPSGKEFIAVGEHEAAIEVLIKKYISTRNFVALMTPLLHLEYLSGHSIHLPIIHDRIVYVVSSYGKWIPDAQTFSFSEALISISPRDDFRPDLVNSDIADFEALLRAEVGKVSGKPT